MNSTRLPIGVRSRGCRAGGGARNDETRKPLKIFGVAVTDFEAEAGRLAAAADRLAPDSSPDQVARLMKDAAGPSQELNARWLEITRRVFALQERPLSRFAEAAARVKRPGGPLRENFDFVARYPRHVWGPGLTIIRGRNGHRLHVRLTRGPRTRREVRPGKPAA
jgi:hypothetical protein